MGICVALAIGLLIAARSASAAVSDALYAEVQVAFFQERFARVVEAVQAASLEPSPEPRGSRVWLWYCLSLDRVERSGDALRQLDRLKAVLGPVAPSTASVWAETLLWEGEIARRALQMVRSRAAYQRLLQEFPDSTWRAQGQLGLGLVLFHHQSYDQALALAQGLLQRVPASPLVPQARLLEGLSFLNLTRFQEAEQVFRRLLQATLDPSLRAQTALYLGEAFNGQERFDAAAEAYQQAIEADRDSIWASLARFGLGWSYAQQRRCRESLAALNADPSIQAGWPPIELAFAQGQCRMQLGDADGAIERFRAVVSQAPRHSLAMHAALSAAQLLRRQRRFSEARGLLEPLTGQGETTSMQEHLSVQLGLLRMEQGDPHGALLLLAPMAASRDMAVQQAALIGLGDAYAMLEQAEEAVRAYERAVWLEAAGPQHRYAVYQLGRLALKRGEAAEAVRLFRRAIEDTAPSAADEATARALVVDARLALALAQIADGQPDAARAELEALRAQQDPVAAARAGYYLAVVALGEGRSSAALPLCQEVIAVAPDSDEAVEAHLLLADMSSAEGSPSSAAAALEQAWETPGGLSPGQRGRLTRKLGDLMRSSGEYARAIGWYERARAVLPSQQDELDYLVASCYEEAGDFILATQRYRNIRSGPWGVRGQLAAAKMMERQARWEEAMDVYDALTRQAVPESKIAAERLAALRSERAVRRP